MNQADTTAERDLHRRLLARGGLVNHYQPIVGLCSGKVSGVEVLGRLRHDERLIAPGAFLDSLTVGDLDDLLFRSLRLGLAALRRCSDTHPELGMSLNVDPAVLTHDSFSRRLVRALHDGGMDPRRITLEILEGNQFLNVSAALNEIHLLRGHGIRIALDDVGTAYSSLMRLKELPVDSIKLDQAFVRGVSRKPDDLQFVASMISLARGLRKRLVVEGVETPEIVNALQVLGVDSAQGYAIARPMPAEALAGWLSGYVGARHSRRPSCLLGAYAAHLVIVETCHLLMNQSMNLTWPASIHDPHACTIGRYLDGLGLHEKRYCIAHKRFHEVITSYDNSPEMWEATAEAFRASLEEAILFEAERLPHAARPPAPSLAAQGCGCRPG